jgi:hypothetical protein
MKFYLILEKNYILMDYGIAHNSYGDFGNCEG